MSHCDKEKEQKLMTLEGWEQINKDQDLIKLLAAMRSITLKHDEVKGGTMNMVDQDVRLYVHSFQKDHEKILEYYKRFTAQCDVIDIHGGQAGYHLALYTAHLEELKDQLTKGVHNMTLDQMKTKATKTSCEEYKASLFLRLANEGRFKDLKSQLDGLNLFNREAYPETMEQALRYLQNYKGKSGQVDGAMRHLRNRNRGNRKGDKGVAIHQKGRARKGGGGRDISNDECYNCGEKGHHAKDCSQLPESEKKQLGVDQCNILSMKDKDFDMIEGVEQLNWDEEEDGVSYASQSTWDSIVDGVGFHEPSQVQIVERDRATCDPKKLYLDSCATHSSIFATEFLERRHRTGVTLRQNSNAGSRLTNWMGFWSEWKFWENEVGIANLLSKPAIKKLGYEVVIMQGKKLVLSPDRKKKWVFKKDTGVCEGLPYIEMTNLEEHVFDVTADEITTLVEAGVIPANPPNKKDGVVMVETICKKYEGYTREQIISAAEARDVMAIMGHPTEGNFVKHVVSSAPVVKIAKSL